MRNLSVNVSKCYTVHKLFFGEPVRLAADQINYRQSLFAKNAIDQSRKAEMCFKNRFAVKMMAIQIFAI